MFHRIDHLVDNQPVIVPAAVPPTGPAWRELFCFVFPTVLYPVNTDTDTTYLIAVHGENLWTLVGLDYLACRMCEDPVCDDIRSWAAIELAAIPAAGSLFTVTEVVPGVAWLPDPLPYLIHIGDAADVGGAASRPIEVQFGDHEH
ncbi:hypothetical protein [Rhodococcus rhodnii]|uniref:hypothetical protein n=1 Tax=Rhodococcus rhodnii TaxID=38312 RepID=UPI000933E1C2|nr:hypothetical protein [Rhodococcus rhodnii]